MGASTVAGEMFTPPMESEEGIYFCVAAWRPGASAPDVPFELSQNFLTCLF